MKKIAAGIILSTMAFAVSAQYDPNHHPRHTSDSMIRGQGWVGPQHHHRARGDGLRWVLPAIIGGAVVYAATRPDPVIVQQPPVIVQQSDIVYINGIAYRKQIMVVNGEYQEVLIKM